MITQALAAVDQARSDATAVIERHVERAKAVASDAVDQARGSVAKVASRTSEITLAKPVPCIVCGLPTRGGDGGACGDVGDMASSMKAQSEPSDVLAVRRCRSCLTEAERDEVVAATKMQHLRLDSFLAGEAEEVHKDPEETVLEKAHRLGTSALKGAVDLVGWIPGLGDLTKNTVKVLYKVVKFGPLAIYSNEIVETVQLLAVLANRSGVVSSAQAKEAAQVAEPSSRGALGGASDAVNSAGMATMEVTELSVGMYYHLLEQRNFTTLDPDATLREHASCEEVQANVVNELVDALPLATPIAYAASAAEAQRQLALVRGSWQLVLAEQQGPGGQPPFIIAADKKAKRAAVLVPGTQTPADCVTDLRALPVHVSSDSGRSIGWVHRGMLRQATALVRLSGSSLERLEKSGYEVIFIGHSLGAGVAAIAGAVCRLGLEGPKLTKVRSLCYATPAVGNGSFGQYCEGHCITVINCDDIVPRLSIETARKLQSELVARKEAVRVFVQQDIAALRDVNNLTEKKTRSGSSSLASGKAIQEAGAETAKEFADLGIPAPRPGAEAEARSALDVVKATKPSDVVLLAATPAAKPKAKKKRSGLLCCIRAQEESDSEAQSKKTAEPEPVEPEETDPVDVRLVPPGRLMHLARHCGARRAWWIRRSQPSLHAIRVHHGIAEDHSGDSYREALTEALAAARGARPKSWKPGGEADVCACCKCDFVWCIFLRSEPHRVAARYHCHSCGEVVCDGCSQRKRPLPEVGVLREVRVCDRCFLRC
eukprot:TRINITY_DN52853_c0_g1_i1.p1 TRINITY_DN52853_c0_g1~~TRINITY_DN52853_c0_g1_i1.p1  ORF type:complete len:770 (+),score=180.78 TRINITY_DN52853_c0_g1_i1:40-2349(+)